MEAGSQLKSVLNLQLASDSSSVFHLPYVLSTLSKDSLSPSPHLAKWSARIISLLHSKDPGARWAGLCIAHKSALLSKSFMVESTASWLPIVIPMLSVRVYFMSASSLQLMQCQEGRTVSHPKSRNQAPHYGLHCCHGNVRVSTTSIAPSRSQVHICPFEYCGFQRRH
jgi:hypothetical protein